MPGSGKEASRKANKTRAPGAVSGRAPYGAGMPRPARIEETDALYHLNSVAVAEGVLYREDDDRFRWIATLAGAIRRFGWICDAYCLMTNHFHLLVQTPEPNLGAGMHWLNSGYAHGFNKRYGRRGHLFNARYHPTPIRDDAHFLAVARYVVLNPVRAGICATAENWPWSSYRATGGLTTPPPFLTTKRILQEFSPRPEVARERYREFVAEGGLPSLDAILALTPAAGATRVPGSRAEV